MLDLTDLEQAEQVLLQAIYQGAIDAVIDEKQHTVYVWKTIHWDLMEEEIDGCLATLDHWVKEMEGRVEKTMLKETEEMNANVVDSRRKKEDFIFKLKQSIEEKKVGRMGGLM